MRPCANQEAQARLQVATEEVARLAVACDAFTRGPNAQVQGRALGMAEARSGGGVPCNAQLGQDGRSQRLAFRRQND